SLSSNGATGYQPPATVSAAAANLSPTILFWWILAVLAVVIGLLVGVLLSVRRQTASNALALLALPSTDGSSNREHPAGGGDWRDRALQAEAIAAKQAQFLRDKVGPDLVEFAKQALVQGLYSQ